MLGRRRRRWANINSTLAEKLVFDELRYLLNNKIPCHSSTRLHDQCANPIILWPRAIKGIGFLCSSIHCKSTL